MNNNAPDSRRQFIRSALALAGAATLAPTLKASANENEFIMAPPATTSIEIHGRNERFPVRRVYCLGRNYRAHAIETGDDPDETPPFFFMKPRDAVRNFRDGFPYPQMTRELRYEVELVVALRGGGRGISESAALDHVYGYGIGLDMTRQDLQAVAQELRRPWAISKSFDHSAPCGPLHDVESNGHAGSGRIWLSVNGDVKQDSDMSLNRWSVPEAISILSSYYELAAGDIILTGTPAGIGLVERGDTIRAGIAGLGEIEVDII